VEQCSELVEYIQIEDGHLDKANRNGISPKNKGFFTNLWNAISYSFRTDAKQ